MNDAVHYSLAFSDFSIDFEVSVTQSIAETIGYANETSQDFAFARAITWVVQGQSRMLISSYFDNGNLLETLANWERHIASIKCGQPLPSYVPLGQWGPWMRGYWERLMEDQSNEGDDDAYKLMSRQMIAEGEGGRLAIYQYGDGLVFEASLPSTAGGAMPHFDYYSIIDGAVLMESIRSLRKDISMLVREQVNLAQRTDG